MTCRRATPALPTQDFMSSLTHRLGVEARFRRSIELIDEKVGILNLKEALRMLRLHGQPRRLLTSPVHPPPSPTSIRPIQSSFSMSLKRKAAVPPTGDASKKPKKNADLTSFFGAPKITPSNPSSTTSSPNSSPTIKFDKQKWLAGLNSEQKSLLQLEIDTLDESWLAVLKDEILSREFLDLKRYLQKEVATQKIYPPMDLVYSWYGLVLSWHETASTCHTYIYTLTLEANR